MMMSTMEDDLPFLSKEVKGLKINKIIKLLFQLVFSTYLPNFLLKFWAGVLVGWKINSSSKEYPCCILSMDLATRKNEKYMKNVIAITFFKCISHFSCSRVHGKYATWVLLGWGIKFCIQLVIPLEIWVKP